MSYYINGFVGENRTLTFEGECGYVGDKNAVELAVDLGDFADDEYDYYVMKFNTSSLVCDANEPMIEIVNDEDSLSTMTEGVIYRMLTDDLTFSGRLQIQIEAHKSGDDRDAIVKTSIAQLEFKPSLSDGRIYTKSDTALLHRIDKLDRRIDELEIPMPVTTTELATYNKVGGFIRGNFSDVDIDGNGHLGVRFDNMSVEMIAGMTAIALSKNLDDYIFILNDISEMVDEINIDIQMVIDAGRDSGIWILCKKGGEITIIDDSYDQAPYNIKDKTLYYIENDNDKCKISEYNGESLRQLIIGGLL